MTARSSPVTTNNAGTPHHRGVSTVTPSSIGQFVVCVSVSEFRDGELLSEVRRDFQFNIVECDPRVEASVTALRGVDSVSADLVLVCGELGVELVDVSTDRNFIDQVEWTIGGTTQGQIMSNESVLNVEFPDFGTYPGVLVANPGLACEDSTEFNIVLSPPGTVDMSFTFDSCTIMPVEFSATVEFDGDISASTFHWDFGDGNTSTEEAPSYQPPAGGRRLVNLTVRDDNGCVYEDVDLLEYFPLPPELLASASADFNCAPAVVSFSQNLELITDEYDVFWDFGDGNTSTLANPNHQYDEPGDYPIFVSVVSPFGCALDTILATPVEVFESPLAGFTFSPTEVDSRDPVVDFIDRSELAVAWQWTFDSLGTSRLTNPSFTFPDSGNYTIELLVAHRNGCLDSTVQQLRIEPFQSYFLPNAFTPNGDGTNDRFRGVGITRYISDFNLQIYNRWGELIFETSSEEEGWDGSNQRNGRRAQGGVYLYKVSFSGLNGEETLTGYVTLVE